jgi:hypothetical protein
MLKRLLTFFLVMFCLTLHGVVMPVLAQSGSVENRGKDGDDKDDSDDNDESGDDSNDDSDDDNSGSGNDDSSNDSDDDSGDDSDAADDNSGGTDNSGSGNSGSDNSGSDNSGGDNSGSGGNSDNDGNSGGDNGNSGNGNSGGDSNNDASGNDDNSDNNSGNDNSGGNSASDDKPEDDDDKDDDKEQGYEEDNDKEDDYKEDERYYYVGSVSANDGSSVLMGGQRLESSSPWLELLDNGMLFEAYGAWQDDTTFIAEEINVLAGEDWAYVQAPGVLLGEGNEQTEAWTRGETIDSLRPVSKEVAQDSVRVVAYFDGTKLHGLPAQFGPPLPDLPPGWTELTGRFDGDGVVWEGARPFP